MSDLMFEQLLAEHNDAFKKAEVFGEDWMPPFDTYYVTILHVKEGIKDKDGKTFGWFKPVGRIEKPEDEQLNGKEFPLGFFNTNALGFLKGFAKGLKGGEEPTDLREAIETIKNSPNLVLLVKVAPSTGKDGKEYTNCYVQEVVATNTNEAAEADAPPQVDPNAPPQEETAGDPVA